MDCGSCKLPELASISLDLTIFDDGVFHLRRMCIGVCGLYDADLNDLEIWIRLMRCCAANLQMGLPCWASFAACYDHCGNKGEFMKCAGNHSGDNPDERIVLFRGLSCGCPVECSVGNAFWAVGQTANDGECQVEFEGIEFLGPGMAGHQNPTWTVDGILSATSYNATFDLEPGTYNICRTSTRRLLTPLCFLSIVTKWLWILLEACPGDLDGNGVTTSLICLDCLPCSGHRACK